MPKVWPREEQCAYYRAFLNARNLWVWMKGYCPIQGDCRWIRASTSDTETL